MTQLVQLIGAALILAAYAAAQAGRLDQRSIPYLLLNLVGSGALAVLAALDDQFGFLLLEGCWSLITLWSLIEVLRGDRSPGGTA